MMVSFGYRWQCSNCRMRSPKAYPREEIAALEANAREHRHPGDITIVGEPAMVIKGRVPCPYCSDFHAEGRCEVRCPLCNMRRDSPNHDAEFCPRAAEDDAQDEARRRVPPAPLRVVQLPAPDED